MITRNVTVRIPIGLHARPATFFIQKANSYKSSIWVEKDERRVNAKSLLGVLSLNITQDTQITLIADGEDEIEALNGLEELSESGLAE
ncbi:MAG: HPr family phosphocarrier protein [Clostridia bacterium]|nr:HPr family phosphocarrier protein [Clostridia bacterium]MBQ3869558.1 HPr family phosphocarrier protein [Clostridia bacterium]